MIFDLSQQQRDLDRTVRDWLTDRFDLTAVRAWVEDSHGEGHPSELWKAAVEQGWVAVTIPERFGGIGLGLLDAAVLGEALGAGLAPGPAVPTVLAADAVRLGGDEIQRARWLPSLASGEVVAAPALRGEGGAWDGSGVEVSIDSDGRLRGRAGIVEYAAVADLLVVAAREPDDISLWVVDPGSRGVEVTAVSALDGTTRAARVALHGAPGQRLACSTVRTYRELVARGCVLAAADLVGAAQRALALTVDYLRTREQFGAPIGRFQAIQHECAELHVGLRLAGQGVRYAAHAHDTALPDAELMASVAKAKASEVAKQVAAATVQFHGAIGFTWEHDAHLFFKRIHRSAFAFGDAAWHRELIAARTIDGDALDELV